MRTGPRQTLESSWEWLEFAAGLPSRAMPITAITAGTLVMSGRAILTGGFLDNVATTAGQFVIYDNTSASGVQVAGGTVAASTISQLSLPVKGILLEIGCFIVPTTATLTGSVYLIPLWHYPQTQPGH